MRGYTREHFRWLLKQLLEEITTLDGKLTALEERIRERMQPHRDLIRRLSTIPGVQETSAWAVIAELGTDMSCFPSAAHAASWAALSPGNCESAGKRQSGRIHKGNRYLRRILVQNGWAASRKKNCFLNALFFRVACRRGMKRAAMAVGQRILTIAYFIIREGIEYREAGQDYHHQQNPEKAARRLTQRLERIGYQVALTKTEVADSTAAQPPKKIKYGTTRWNISRLSPSGPSQQPLNGSPKKRTNRPTTRVTQEPPATPDICPKCAVWRIPCIHARNTITNPKPHIEPGDSVG